MKANDLISMCSEIFNKKSTYVFDIVGTEEELIDAVMSYGASREEAKKAIKKGEITFKDADATGTWTTTLYMELVN